MIYEIAPLDNYFFRCLVPFEAGGDNPVSQGKFPPLPSTYAGAFRMLVKDRENSSRKLKVGFNGLAWKGKIHFPMPADLYLHKQTAGDIWNIKIKQLKKNILSNYPLTHMMCIQEDKADKEREQKLPYLSEDVIGFYLNADFGKLTFFDIRDKIIRENRIGEEMKLVVDVNAELMKESGIIKFDGEGKKAIFNQAQSQIAIYPELGKDRYFKLYLATPAIFRNGWLPGWIDADKKMGYFSHKNKRVTVRLASACVGRKILCGGFGFGKDKEEERNQYRPRELRYAVPAGSVYYFELLQGTFEDAVKLFHMKCISDYREKLGFDYQVFNKSRYCDRGFGYALVGKVSKEQEKILSEQTGL